MMLTVEIPDDVVRAMHLSASVAQTEVNKELCLVLYARGLLSLGKAVELAGIARPEFEAVLARRRIERPYEMAELERDLAWAERGK
jgi:predicted HTH domain antitoxin